MRTDRVEALIASMTGCAESSGRMINERVTAGRPRTGCGAAQRICPSEKADPGGYLPPARLPPQARRSCRPRDGAEPVGDREDGSVAHQPLERGHDQMF